MNTGAVLVCGVLAVMLIAVVAFSHSSPPTEVSRRRGRERVSPLAGATAKPARRCALSGARARGGPLPADADASAAGRELVS